MISEDILICKNSMNLSILLRPACHFFFIFHDILKTTQKFYDIFIDAGGKIGFTQNLTQYVCCYLTSGLYRAGDVDVIVYELRPSFKC